MIDCQGNRLILLILQAKKWDVIFADKIDSIKSSLNDWEIETLCIFRSSSKLWKFLFQVKYPPDLISGGCGYAYMAAAYLF